MVQDRGQRRLGCLNLGGRGTAPCANNGQSSCTKHRPVAAAAGSAGGGDQSGQAWKWCSGTSGWPPSCSPIWEASWAASWAPSWGPRDGGCSGVSDSGIAGGEVKAWGFTPVGESCARSSSAESEQC
eukprot:scaffold42015_cov69-Phaeocystis_antarctica.AAC.1